MALYLIAMGVALMLELHQTLLISVYHYIPYMVIERFTPTLLAL